MSNEVTVAVVGLISAVVIAIIGLATKVHAKAAQKAAEDVSDAVNHTHATGQKRMYDLLLDVLEKVNDLSAWREKWRDLDPDIRDGHSLSDKIEGIERSVNSLRMELRAHVEWEERVKYPSVTNREHP